MSTSDALTAMMLSEHFSLEELFFSRFAIEHGIDNTPDERVADQLKSLALGILEPVRAIHGLPVIVDCGYRCPAVNSGVGGAPDSQHLLGQAADIRIPGVSHNRLMHEVIASGIMFDEIIYEAGELGWIHISCSIAPRRKALQTPTGKAPYLPFP